MGLAQPTSLHPYQYALNSPLQYTDPSGAFVPLLIGAIALGALLGAGANYGLQVYDNYRESGQWNRATFTEICVGEVLIAALGGGVAGGVGFFVGPAISGVVGTGLRGSLIAGALEGILSDTLATAAMTWASGRTLTAEMLATAALGGALSGGAGGWLGWRWAGRWVPSDAPVALLPAPRARGVRALTDRPTPRHFFVGETGETWVGTQFTLTRPAQRAYLATHVQGLTTAQADFLLTQVIDRRNGSIVFGGSRVRGNAHIDTSGTVVSDLDVGFVGLSRRQISRIVDDFNREFTGSSRGANQIIEHNWIFPGSRPSRYVSEIRSPEEFFMRSGVRGPYDGSKAGQPFVPSGYIKVSPDGMMEVVQP